MADQDLLRAKSDKHSLVQCTIGRC